MNYDIKSEKEKRISKIMRKKKITEIDILKRKF
jgi:hypothetical protein